jgi:hypothetical protein
MSRDGSTRRVAPPGARDPVRAIADAVLYEGYLLWPYRRSATKNQRRWTFGGVYPRGHSREHADDPWTMRAECLLEAGSGARVAVTVRFLHIVERAVARQGEHGLEKVDELTVGGERHLAWDEAVEREVATPRLPLDALAAGHDVAVAVPGGREKEDLLEPGRDDAPRIGADRDAERGDAARAGVNRDAERGDPARAGANRDAERVGAIIRSWQPLAGTVTTRAERLDAKLARVSVVIANETPWTGGTREAALRRTFCSTHAVLRVEDGAFVSQTDPPEALREAAEACRNEGCWPVLVGEPGDRTTVLASPIILEDHPRIAPESPGDLFDGGEIDQLLVLNILSLTEAEKAEMRATDARAREILERTEALTPEQLMRLHGAIREFGMAR